MIKASEARSLAEDFNNKKKLSSILEAVEKRAKEGVSHIVWLETVSVNTIKALEELGYEVYPRSGSCKINW